MTNTIEIPEETETEFDPFRDTLDKMRRRIRLVLRYSDGEECCQLGPTIDGTEDLQPLLEIYHTLESILRGNDGGLYVAIKIRSVRLKREDARKPEEA